MYCNMTIGATVAANDNSLKQFLSQHNILTLKLPSLLKTVIY